MIFDALSDKREMELTRVNNVDDEKKNNIISLDRDLESIEGS